MKIFLKILFFPIRLIAFLLLAAISIVLQYASVILIYAVSYASPIGAFLFGLAGGMLLLYSVGVLIFREYFETMVDGLHNFIILGVVSLGIAALFLFGAKLIVAALNWILVFSAWLMELAKSILFGRKIKKSEKAGEDELHAIEIDEDVDEKATIKGIQEAAKLFNKYGVNSVDELEKKISEQLAGKE